MIDNTHLGGRLIYDNFGVSPKTTWQIDPVRPQFAAESQIPSPYLLTQFFPSLPPYPPYNFTTTASQFGHSTLCVGRAPPISTANELIDIALKACR